MSRSNLDVKFCDTDTGMLTCARRVSGEGHLLAIGTVAAQLGISPDVLRKWETRHGWPVPYRVGGKRQYDELQRRQLLIARRLMQCGHPVADALAMAHRGEPATQTLPQKSTQVEALVALAGAGDFTMLRGQLLGLRAQLDEVGFIEDCAAPLMQAVGQAWSAGQLRVWQEHAISGIVHDVLAVPSGEQPPESRTGQPLALLSTPPGERHSLGLDMAKRILLAEGVDCITLGVETPLEELVAAAHDSGADIVGLSVSRAYAARAIHRFARALRATLPARCALWLGGAGASCARTRDQQEITVCGDAESIRRALAGHLPHRTRTHRSTE